MTATHKIMAAAAQRALSGEGAHAGSLDVFDGIDWKLASVRPSKAPHTLFQILNHVIYWQNWVLQWLDGKEPPLPKHASGSWPGSDGPAAPDDWIRAVADFQLGLKALELACAGTDLLGGGDGKTRLEMLHTIASHNSYHLGQAVLLRQMLGAWPPSSGGFTW